MSFTPLFVPSVPAREPEPREGSRVKKEKRKKIEKEEEENAETVQVRLFVFATETGEAFISNPQSPSVINHN